MEDQQSTASVPQRRERQDALEHRRLILAAAKQIFATQGVENTSMYEIARAAGVGQGTLYRRFAHKGELCQALIAEDVDAYKDQVLTALSGAGAPASALERLDILIVELIRLTTLHLPLFAAIDETAAGQRRPRPFHSPFHVWLHERIAGLLAEAVAKGEIEPLDVEFTADAILAVLAPPFISHQHQDRGCGPERIAAGVHHLFVESLRRGPTTFS